MATEEAAGGLQIHPMDQFVVKPLFGDGPIEWYTPTNVTLWMGIAVLAMIALLVLSTRRRAIVPSRGQSVAEMFYGFIYKMVEDVAGHEGLKYFPYVMTLFMFVFLSNMLGLIPMSFTTTSHIAVTATLALLVFFTVTVVGLVRKGPAFLAMFWVSSAPLALRGLLDAVHVGGECSLESGLEYESAQFGLLFATQDMREGTAAFLERRKPAFQGA